MEQIYSTMEHVHRSAVSGNGLINADANIFKFDASTNSRRSPSYLQLIINKRVKSTKKNPKKEKISIQIISTKISKFEDHMELITVM